MVGKLIKHELIAYGRILLFYAIGLLAFTVLTLILLVTQPQSPLTMIAVLFYVYALMAMFIVVFVLAVQRFGKTLFSGEGYLTLSLPVTADELIWAKLLSALLAEIFAVAVAAVSLVILMSVDMAALREALAAFGELFAQIELYLRHDPLIIVELAVLIIVSIPMGMLSLYFIMSLAQLFTRHRVGIAFGIGVALSFVLSILNTVILLPLLELIPNEHVSVWIMIAVYLLMDVVYFLIVRYILKNKVNLIV